MRRKGHLLLAQCTGHDVVITSSVPALRISRRLLAAVLLQA
jgi:hypothetical protein